MIVWNIQSSSIVSKYNFEREISVLQKHPSKSIALVATKGGSAYLWNYKKNTVQKLNTSKGSILTGTKMVDDNQTYWIIGNDQGEVTVFSEEGRQLSQKALVRVCVLFMRIKVLWPSVMTTTKFTYSIWMRMVCKKTVLFKPITAT